MKTKMILLLLVASIFLVNCSRKDFNENESNGKTVARCVGVPISEQYQISGPAILCGGDTSIYTIPGLHNVYPAGGYVNWSVSDPSIVSLIPSPDGTSVKVIKTGLAGNFNLNAFVYTAALCFNNSGDLDPKFVTTQDIKKLLLGHLESNCAAILSAVATGDNVTYEWSTDGVNFTIGGSEYYRQLTYPADNNKTFWAKITNNCGSVIRSKTVTFPSCYL